MVNNAGYANLAPIETGDEGDFRTQFETNFWGVYNVSRAVIAQLREQGGGTIVQFSSIGGRVGGSPGIASYQAAKFAVDGFSRVLAVETAPFGIKVMVVEPSGFATDWAGSSMTIHDIPADYDATIGAMHRRMRANTSGAAGDPVRAAEILVQVVKRGERAVAPAAGGERSRHGARLLAAAAGRGHGLGGRQPVGRLLRAVPGRVPGGQAERTKRSPGTPGRPGDLRHKERLGAGATGGRPRRRGTGLDQPGSR